MPRIWFSAIRAGAGNRRPDAGPANARRRVLPGEPFLYVPAGRGVRRPGALAQPVAGHARKRGEERQVGRDVALDGSERLLQHQQPAPDLGGIEPRRVRLEPRDLVAVDERLGIGAVAQAQDVAQPELLELDRQPEPLAP